MGGESRAEGIGVVGKISVETVEEGRSLEGGEGEGRPAMVEKR